MVSLMAILMMVLGALVGQTLGVIAGNSMQEVHGQPQHGLSFSTNGWADTFFSNPYWLYGMGIALVIWGIQSIVAYFAGGDIMLAVSGASEIDSKTHPVLFNIVEEMSIAAGLATPPRIFIIPSEVPNAFATGTRPDKSAVAVTAGLLGRLNRDELQGVIAHEISHIINRDVMFMTMVGIMLGTIILISQVFLRSLWFSGSGRYSNKRENNAGAIVIMVLAILLAIIAPILAQLIYFSASRKREYLADASAVRLTRYPAGLANALEKISISSGKMEQANKVTAPMYINDPMNKKMALSGLTSTHPPIAKRIEILRKLSGDIGYQGYESAYSSVNHGHCIPQASLADSEAMSARNADVTTAAVISAAAAARKTGDTIMAMNKYAFINCSCGLKLKLPPEFKKPKAKCPKCGKVHDIRR